MCEKTQMTVRHSGEWFTHTPNIDVLIQLLLLKSIDYAVDMDYIYYKHFLKILLLDSDP